MDDVIELREIGSELKAGTGDIVASSEAPLKILMILHMPWTRELGAPRVSLEIAEELEKLGHKVDKFDINDAFPKKSAKFLDFFQMTMFPGRAAQFVRANGRNYDVIQAEQGNLPYSKTELGFQGVLIARSNGLAHFYEEYHEKMARKLRLRGERRGTPIGNVMRWAAKRMENSLRNVETSFNTADAIVLINTEEIDYVSNTLGHGTKSYLLPNGLSETRFSDFAEWHVEPAQRLKEQRIVFVGHWSERKGADDFPTIVRLVRQRVPGSSFLFLGTGKTAEAIKSNFAETDRPSIAIIPSYASPDLPELLSNSTIGVFPSYIEGFPFGVLEQLAAGLPTVAYDVPGPREMLKHFIEPMLVKVGNTEAIADRLVKLLWASQQQYSDLSSQALKVADRFHWSSTARQMLMIYTDKQEKLSL